MNGLKQGWILVGVLLWGLPTGFGLSFVLANVSWSGGVQLISGSAESFGRLSLILVPLFVAAGCVLGITMGNVCERAVRK